MKKWYKDRDFPEVKISNADILAVIMDQKQLERVIKLQNELMDELWNVKEHLAISEQNVKDFEKLAQEWKKGYSDLEIKHKVKLIEMQQIIDELNEQIEATDKFIRQNYSRN